MPAQPGVRLLHGASMAAGVAPEIRMTIGVAPKLKQERGRRQAVWADSFVIRHAAISLAWFVRGSSAAVENLFETPTVMYAETG
jgi:hypothetical protein